MKPVRIIFSAIVAAAGVWLCVAQDTMPDRPGFYIYPACASLLITLAVAFGIFTFIKHSFGRFIGVTVVVNAAICIFHAYKYPYNVMNVGGFASHMEWFVSMLPYNLLVAAGVSAVCILGYKLIDTQRGKTTV